MAKIERFEEVKAWQIAKDLVMEIYRNTDHGRFHGDMGLRDQVRRAAVSVMSNIAEGFERGIGKEFKRFLFMAKGSAGEVRSHLHVARELGYLDADVSGKLLRRSEEVAKLISGFIKYLSNGRAVKTEQL